MNPRIFVPAGIAINAPGESFFAAWTPLDNLSGKVAGKVITPLACWMKSVHSQPSSEAVSLLWDRARRATTQGLPLIACA